MEGWIKLHRQIADSQVFASEKALKIWVWLILKARHDKGFVNITIGKGNSVIELERGQLLFGRFTAEEALNIDGSTIYKWIHKFKEWNMINIESNSHSTIITICNYDIYNPLDDIKVTTIRQPFDNHSTAIQQPCNTNKNEEKDKNKYTFSSFYDKEIEDNKDKPEIENYKLFVKFLFGENEMNKRMDCWLNLRDQISYIELQKLRDKATEKKRKLRDMIISGYNNPRRYLKGNVSFYATLNSWLNR